MPDNRTIAERVIDVLERELGEERARIIAPGATLRELGADSLDLVEITIEAEKEFDIDIADEEFQRWVTPADVIGTVERAVSARAH